MGLFDKISLFKKKTIKEKMEARKKKDEDELKSELNPYLYPKKISHMVNTMKLTRDKEFLELGINSVDEMIEYLETVNEQMFVISKNFLSEKGERPAIMSIGNYGDFPTYQTVYDDLVSQFGGGKYNIRAKLPKPGTGVGYYMIDEEEPISKEDAQKILNPKKYSADPEERIQGSMKVPRAPKGASFEETFFYNFLASNPDAMKNYGQKILEEKGLGSKEPSGINATINDLTEKALAESPELLEEIVMQNIKRKFKLKDNEEESFIEQYRNLKQIESELQEGKSSNVILDAIKDVIPILPALISEGGKFMGSPQPQSSQPQSQPQIEAPKSDLDSEIEKIEELENVEEEPKRDEITVNIAGQGNVSVDPVMMSSSIEVKNKELAEMYITQNKANLKLIVSALSSSIESGANPSEMIEMIKVMAPQTIPHLKATSVSELMEYVKLLESDSDFVDHVSMITSNEGEAWIIDFISKIQES